ncbi:MAG: hypothetical protein A2653_02330 [Candidatus Zambryskibacteria bacterium RIFCSPHIGHO2_01_FULL_43_25]|uniref:Glutamyl-tRNA amidotransferase n=1 Tax=Candidatus Zambryskibacteria bacterium RIFCSPLOWO2_01_FULL_45_21 TaxID=1802761 RepID=A0A1G2U4W0_9BACT|nr:MAG: hypothetical protein A2653_02330 [Candidatus Zambryskibacteria bacterium RIFCSPHIGHO2_01_FULL_43_25]OHB01075.1 MAG: hypothetical protein A3E94_02510 [Candidatus Zambryskibacteria bacterium RIFCSPHIGHO2_12_FULL_44_12b]OHB03960.1 MAG: hypothetical protein A3B14_01120 [Candidatus Zambryskibacteria bacterium RIFCSPLOWO2_01_FULL_45_21]
MIMHDKIQQEIAAVMKARDTVRLNTLRGLLAAFTNELVAKRRKPTEKLADDEAVAVIMRSIKQHKDSIEQFEKGGRQDLVDEEKKELAILEEYAPKMMSKDEILPIAQKKKNELGITDPSKIGMLMGAIAKELKGKADGKDIKDIVDSLF